MTNLLLAYPSTNYSVEAESSQDSYGLENLNRNSRSQIFYVTTKTSSTLTLTFSCVEAATASFLAIARADLLQKEGVTAIYLKANTSNTTTGATTVWSSVSFQSRTLYGSRAEDLIVTFSESSAYEYWFLQIVNSNTYAQFPMSKVYIGNMLDFGCEPSLENSVTKTYSIETVANRFPKRSYSLYWASIDDSTCESFETILKNSQLYDFNFYLYDAADVVIDETRLLHCRIARYQKERPLRNVNNITCIFEECV